MVASLMPGDITDDGRIVAERAFGMKRVPMSNGTIWLSADKLPDAERFGWLPNGETAQDGALVLVSR